MAHYYNKYIFTCEFAELEKQERNDDIAKYYEDIKDGELEEPWKYRYNFNVSLNYSAFGDDYGNRHEMHSVFNVFFLNDLYFGGAHGLFSEYCEVFSLKTGARITLSDLFTVGEETYKRRICEELCTVLEAENHWLLKDLHDDTPQEKVYNNCKDYICDGAFALSVNGLTIMLTTGAIGSNGDGPAFFVIPFECLEDIMIPPETIADIGTEVTP